MNNYLQTIYIAGFDVFSPNAVEMGEKYKKICREYGFIGLYPYDSEVKKTNKGDAAKEIFKGNMKLIKKSQIIVANLNNFRGAEIDSGTAFECGVSYAKKKRMYGYMKDGSSVIKKVDKYYSSIKLDNGIWVDKDGYIIENFELPLNLMLSVPMKLVIGNFEQCIAKIKMDLDVNLK